MAFSVNRQIELELFSKFTSVVDETLPWRTIQAASICIKLPLSISPLRSSLFVAFVRGILSHTSDLVGAFQFPPSYEYKKRLVSVQIRARPPPTSPIVKIFFTQTDSIAFAEFHPSINARVDIFTIEFHISRLKEASDTYILK